MIKFWEMYRKEYNRIVVAVVAVVVEHSELWWL